MSYHEAIDHTESDDSDVWHVQLGSGEVRLMTLDELDEAFQAGVIHENTYLWQEGATGWVTLREVAGLDGGDDGVQATNGAGNPFTETQPYSAQYASADSVWPPAPAASSFPAQTSYAPPLQAFGPHSTAPVASSLDFDIDAPNFGRKKGSGLKMVVATLLVGAAGFGAVKYKLVPIPQDAPPPPVVTAAASPVPTADIATAQAAQTPPPPTPAPEPAKQLSDDVKQRLADADSKLVAKQKAKQQQLQQTRAAAGSRAPRSKASMGGDKVFHKGGETGDPLNSSL